LSGALDPIQEDLPLELPAGTSLAAGSNTAGSTAAGSTAAGSDAGLPAWKQAPAPPGPSLYERGLTWVRSLPWDRWRRQATPVIQGGAHQVGAAVRLGAEQVGTVARVAITRGAPYTARLAKATATTGLVPGIALWISKGIHVLGLPAVVMRAAVQVLIVHRSGLAIEEAVFFRLDDPAAYTVYEAPPQIGLAATIAFVPTLVTLTLAVICLAPALAPASILHLPATWLTWVETWLGLAFGAHALPAYEEAGPLAEQARVGVGKANPAALALVAPAYAVAWITRFGGLLPALAGGLAAFWLAGAVMRLF